MIKLKKIMVATDFSPHSEVAISYATEFAKTFDAEVLVTAIVEEPSLMAELPPMGEAYFPPNLAEIQQQSAEKACQKKIEEHGLKNARVVVEIGTPFVEIVRIAREEEVDMIIIGTHGRGAIAHMLLGSVAEKIVRKAPCPVLTVRSGEHEFIQP
ncbi:Putative universal stress protein [Polystyrenella longa]|uniref:Universal stress protein n=1 Tax=Polystyrenella longa TaxID=2528007 RepID=A0A518CJP2_9PLAN|nr:universal stress protein [Polystyrenella longa]QDU79449.1 Putative universal stress protein [Polystyrenella longa]